MYADALTECGQVLGRFINGSLALEALDPLDSAWPRLHAELERIRVVNAGEWLGDFLSVVQNTHLSRVALDRFRNADFQGGLLRRVALFETEWPAWQQLASSHPLSGVELLTADGLPWRERPPEASASWRQFKLSSSLRPASSTSGWFVANVMAGALRWLGPELSHLDLAGFTMSQGGVALLTGDRHDLDRHCQDFLPPAPLARGQLQSLMLDGCRIGADGVSMLCRTPVLEGLHTLSLAHSNVHESDVFHG